MWIFAIRPSPSAFIFGSLEPNLSLRSQADTYLRKGYRSFRDSYYKYWKSTSYSLLNVKPIAIVEPVAILACVCYNTSMVNRCVVSDIELFRVPCAWVLSVYPYRVFFTPWYSNKFKTFSMLWVDLVAARKPQVSRSLRSAIAMESVVEQWLCLAYGIPSLNASHLPFCGWGINSNPCASNGIVTPI